MPKRVCTFQSVVCVKKGRWEIKQIAKIEDSATGICFQKMQEINISAAK
jgi:hypothetical protein